MSKRVKVKPSKASSGLNFFVGIIFCIIGIVIVIPTAGAFGFLWTVIAIGITISSGINAFSDKGIPTSEIVIEDDKYPHYFNGTENESLWNTQGAANRMEENTKERLQTLERLYQSGMITIEEYEKKRESIINEL